MTLNTLLKFRYSFAAGACAAGGSFFGKLPSVLLASRLLPSSIWPQDLHFYLEFILLQALPLALMVICNVLNWRYFLKALQLSDQTLSATVLTAASNYVISFVLAAFVYQEPVTLLSVAGSTFIVAGLWFLCGADNKQEKKSKAL